MKPSSLGVFYTISASDQFLSQGSSGLGSFPSTSRMLSTALFSCRWELSEANDLGRRAQGASPGVLAWPCPCQEDEPCPAQVRAPRGTGWPHLEPTPISPPGHHLDFGNSSSLRCLFPALCQAALLSSPETLMLELRGAERAFCAAGVEGWGSQPPGSERSRPPRPRASR